MKGFGMGKYLINKVIYVISAFCFFSLSAIAAEYPEEVLKVLDESMENRAELETVLEHYAAEGDALKLRAAEFLIGNMDDHCYVTYVLKDTLDNTIPFEAVGFDDFDTLLAAVDSLEKVHGTVDFKRDKRIDDIKTIKAEFLIEQIEYAFRVWHERPWAKDYTFEQLCNYILPYRGSNEPLSDWRSYFHNRYRDLTDKMADSTSAIEAAALINDDVMSWFTFDRRFYFHPTDEGLTEMLEYGMGRCEDMTNLATYAMRANGLAVTSDYTPHWANSGNNHAWNALVLPDGTVLPFMGAEANPGKYNLRYRLAKAYRKMYAQQHDDLVFLERKQEEIPGWLAGKSYIDVTAAYVPVSNVLVKLKEVLPDSVDIAYLCVFNSGEWRAIAWGRSAQNIAEFHDMGIGVAYLPALYLNKEIIPWGAPFILDSVGQKTMLRADQNGTTDIVMNSTTKVYRDISTDGVEPAELVDGTEYELFYWDGEWKSSGTAVAVQNEVRFEKVPSGGLYWMKGVDSDGEERIFTFENNAPHWW